MTQITDIIELLERIEVLLAKIERRLIEFAAAAEHFHASVDEVVRATEAH